MSTSQTAFKAFSRICAVSAVLGVALATGPAAAASTVTTASASHITKAASPLGGHDDDDGNNGCIALIALLC
ncbi:hypothetical protein [Streptomyces alanosinicus]|uniref:Chaplin n=1 Tax=Streptomyces alanosinicus TaxID=68171 RepID=A0A919D2G3_9ACTN|nr:hypothetical protein [Streptomyces alanosinicus]GHE00725.1 hypothetical protein GCM10010339_17230 [Streptomyces alanosinicus]